MNCIPFRGRQIMGDRRFYTFYHPNGYREPRREGPAFSGPPLPQFLHHSREAVEDMEQPLDLSQPTIERNQKVMNIDMEEPICQYTNCSCSLKHILSLDKKDQQNEPFRSRSETLNSGDYSGGHFQKRFPEQTENTQGHFHPKRRKIEEYKESLSRSSSDTNLQNYCGPTDPFRSFTYYSGDDMSQRNMADEKVQPYWKSSQTFTATNTYPSGESSNSTTNSSSSEAKKLPQHAERLPKKRSHARNLSYENSFRGTLPTGNEIKSSRTPSPQPEMVCVDSEMSQGIEERKSQDDSNLPELKSSPKTNGDELRASIMAELHDENDNEDVNEFRKRFFGSLFSRAKAPSTKKGKPSALDILISNKNTEDFEFRPTNSHIDQIIRGEKPGKLCLMDIVELQVEIGLA